jgi:hypothetical protein
VASCSAPPPLFAMAATSSSIARLELPLLLLLRWRVAGNLSGAPDAWNPSPGRRPSPEPAAAPPSLVRTAAFPLPRLIDETLPLSPCSVGVPQTTGALGEDLIVPRPPVSRQMARHCDSRECGDHHQHTRDATHTTSRQAAMAARQGRVMGRTNRLARNAAAGHPIRWTMLVGRFWPSSR